MKVSEAIKYRRSVRVFDDKNIDSEKVKNCLINATLAANSSNLQLWEFVHVEDKKILKELSKACFNQNAAKTAKQLVVIVVRKDLWSERAKWNIKEIKDQSNKNDITIKRLNQATVYYNKIIPTLYFDLFGLLGFFKSLIFQAIGLFRPTMRQVTSTDTRIVAHKSAALAAQNFMISMAGIGYDTCPMEGSDTLLVKKILKLNRKAEISMVIGCGLRTEKGIYGEQLRVPFNQVYTYI
ncbi:MAG: nitroreductase family protein [Flavobacteriaceae bacterium]|nr:nitroreductase family protein [Flavobacteriaceae bacterium]